MIFNSYSFLVFAILFFALFYLMPQRWKVGFILLSSYFFYAWWNPWFLGLIWLSTLIDYSIAQQIYKTKEKLKKKQFLWLSIGFNLGVLAYFKYFDFFADSFQILLSKIGFETSGYYLDVLLPVGISFYTFQTMAYSIDVYRNKIKPETSLMKFALYVAYFPQLVAGPIERANQLLPQIAGKLKPTSEQIKQGVWLVAWGFLLKTVIADNLAPIVNETFNHPNPSKVGSNIWIAVLAFCLQIYGDFAGYSKIARGISKFIGIDLQMNFNHPFFAFSPSDFWRRWHITLSQWLRDYLYISLGGNRSSNIFTLRNLMITMLLGGLWHGASWVFVLWGLYHGLLLVIFRLTLEKTSFFKSERAKFIFIPTMFFLSLYGWLIFRSENMPQLIAFSKEFLSFNFSSFSEASNQINLFWILLFYILVIVVDFVCEKFKSEYLLSFNYWLHLIPLFLMFTIIYLLGAPQSEFIYFQF